VNKQEIEQELKDLRYSVRHWSRDFEFHHSTVRDALVNFSNAEIPPPVGSKTLQIYAFLQRTISKRIKPNWDENSPGWDL